MKLNARPMLPGLPRLIAGLSIAGLVLLAGCPGIMPPNNGGGDPCPDDPNCGVTGKYAGSDACIVCHPNTHTNWSATLHANALATLEAIGQGENAVCLPCHTVGFGLDGGYVDRQTTLSLANVGCEACHGPAKAHAMNVNDASLLPSVSLNSADCGRCHNGSHHPHYEEWSRSAHASVNEVVAQDVVEGSGVNNCGRCHIGETFFLLNVEGREVDDDFYLGTNPASIPPTGCAVCHDPHQKTGNAVTTEDGRDFQLRFPEVAYPNPMNSVTAATDRTRFNLCGQCHYSRGRTWESDSRPPHHSVQANFYAGEMPMPEGMEDDPLAASRTSVHSFTAEQCATCHMHREDFESEQAPAIAGHTFAISLVGCATPGCHTSPELALASLTALSGEVNTRLAGIVDGLGDPSTWEYIAEGGPDADEQALLSDEVKQIRYLYHYILSDGSLGVHNPAYVREILTSAEALLALEQNGPSGGDGN